MPEVNTNQTMLPTLTRGLLKGSAFLLTFLSGGFFGAVYTHWKNTEPAKIEPDVRNLGFVLGKPLLGLVIDLQNSGPSPGVVTSIKVTLTTDSGGRKTENNFSSVFTSGHLEDFRVLPSGNLATAQDTSFDLFLSLMVPADRPTTAVVWFQPSSTHFVFEALTYKCMGELAFSSRGQTQTVKLAPFAFTLADNEAQAVNLKDKSNVLLPIKIDGQTPNP
jgi:hypothetical protein